MTLVGITGFKPDVWAVDRLEVGSIPTPSRHHLPLYLHMQEVSHYSLINQMLLVCILSAKFWSSLDTGFHSNP